MYILVTIFILRVAVAHFFPNKITKFTRNLIFPNMLAIISFNILSTVHTAHKRNRLVYSMRDKCMR